MPRYAVIECEDSPKWADGFASFMLPAFKESDEEEWVVFKTAIDGSLPSASEKWDGFVLTGSHYNTRDGVPWQAPLMDYLRTIHVPSGEAGSAVAASAPRVIGICYGHQLIAHTFGGQVDTNPSGRFVLKAERLVPTPALAAQSFASDFVELDADGTTVRVRDVHDGLVASRSSSDEVLSAAKDAAWVPALGLLESHGDCVRALPADATLLASSPSCTHEMVLTGTNFLSTQGHPEFDYKSCIAERTWPAVVGERQRLSKEEQADAMASFEAPRHSRLLLEMLRRFLKRRG